MASRVMYFHVWFSTKYRKWLLQGDVEVKVKQVFQQVALERSIDLVEYETVTDHVHMLLNLSSSGELPRTMQLLKGRASYEVFRAYPDVMLDAGVLSLWQDGYNSRMVPDAQVPTVRRYVQTQDERLENYER
jgi:putative transposase